MAFSFKKAEQPVFKTKVEIPVPNGLGGHDKNSFMAHFKRATSDELKEMAERQLSDADLARDRLVGWDMTDADSGEIVEFSQDRLEAVLQIPPSPKYIAIAFWRAASGGKG